MKSMLGEQANAVEISDRGVFGDRAYAVVESAGTVQERDRVILR